MKEAYNSNDMEKSRIAYNMVLKFFKGDEKKTKTWFLTKSMLLGDVSPMFMIYTGRIDKLLGYIYSSLEGNFP